MNSFDDLPEKFRRPLKELSYEEALSELEDIVSILEQGEQPLNISLALFGRGQALSGYCAGILEDADLKVQQLVDGELIDFNAED